MKTIIFEGNKLIAEFMGGKGELILSHTLIYKFKDKDIKAKDLKYHKRWDWLMPVIEKIEKIDETNEKFGTICDISTIYIKIGDVSTCLKTEMYNSKIEAVYYTIIKFIHQYNFNKSRIN